MRWRWPRWLRSCQSVDPVTGLQCMLQLDHDRRGPDDPRIVQHFCEIVDDTGERVTAMWTDPKDIRRVLHLPPGGDR